MRYSGYYRTKPLAISDLKISKQTASFGFQSLMPTSGVLNLLPYSRMCGLRSKFMRPCTCNLKYKLWPCTCN